MTHGPQAVGHTVQELTRGKPYAFVLMSYEKRYHVYKHFKPLVEEFGLACLRADEVRLSAHDLLAKIHVLIERADVVIAEISEPSLNVFYEVGYAVAKQKPLLLLIEAGKKIPTDLKGLELVEYGGSKAATQRFEHEFRNHLRARIGSRLALLRDLLEADIPKPTYILASPKYPGPDSRIRGQPPDRRTFGDNIGIAGLLSAFGRILGEDSGVELLSARSFAKDIIEGPLNLYLIGSGKVNKLTQALMPQVQGEGEPFWSFDNAEGGEKTGDWPVGLFRTAGGKRILIRGQLADRAGATVHVVDHGIIIRAPHPHHPGRLVMIAAGAHSLGTGAACLAMTRSSLIQQIRDALPSPVALSDKGKLLWVLVRGQVDQDDHISEQGVTVLEVGVR